MSGKVIEGAKATVTISCTDGKTRTFDLTSVSFDERLPADGSYPAFFLEGKVTGRALRANYTKSKLPDIDVDLPVKAKESSDFPNGRSGMGVAYDAQVLREALKVMRSAAANDPARRADAIAALNRYWPEWHLTDPEILGFRGGFPRGNNTVLYGPAAKPKAPSEEVQQEIADLKQSFWTILGPPFPNTRIHAKPTPHKACTHPAHCLPEQAGSRLKHAVETELRMEPTGAICRCDIKDLMSTGHLAGCPEKKR